MKSNIKKFLISLSVVAIVESNSYSFSQVFTIFNNLRILKPLKTDKVAIIPELELFETERLKIISIVLIVIIMQSKSLK